jgi:predicted transcriptional regulator
VKSILVLASEACPCCNSGETIDHVKTGAAARHWRKNAGVSQKSVATSLGITQAGSNYLEHGHRRWSREMIAKFDAIASKHDERKELGECVLP